MNQIDNNNLVRMNTKILHIVHKNMVNNNYITNTIHHATMESLCFDNIRFYFFNAVENLIRFLFLRILLEKYPYSIYSRYLSLSYIKCNVYMYNMNNRYSPD